jgi:hypothetical protein
MASWKKHLLATLALGTLTLGCTKVATEPTPGPAIPDYRAPKSEKEKGRPQPPPPPIPPPPGK